jgi:hypothetical protein
MNSWVLWSVVAAYVAWCAAPIVVAIIWLGVQEWVG